MEEGKDKNDSGELTGKQRRFCEEYIFDFNASRAYKTAYPDAKSEDGIRASASALLTNPNVKAYIQHLQADLEKVSGISRLRVLREHEKMAFSSIAHLHNTWIERKEFNQLTDEQKACIQEISTQVRTVMQGSGENKVPVDVEFVKIKLFDKQKALDSISKILGHYAAEKVEIIKPEPKATSEDRDELLKEVMSKLDAIDRDAEKK